MRNIIRSIVRWLFAVLLIAGYAWLLLWNSVWSVIIISTVFFVIVGSTYIFRHSTHNRITIQAKKAS